MTARPIRAPSATRRPVGCSGSPSLLTCGPRSTPTCVGQAACDCVSYWSGPPVHYSTRITATRKRCQRIIAVLVWTSIQRSRSMPVTSRRRTTREDTDRRISRLSAQRNVQANLAMLRSPLLSMNVSPSRRRTIGRLSTLTSSWSTDSSGDALTTSSSPVIVTTVSKEAVYILTSTLDVRYRMRLALSIRTRE